MPFLYSAFLATLFIFLLFYFGYKSGLRSIKYLSTLLLVLTLLSWLSPLALLLNAILIIAYSALIIVLSKRNKNNKMLFYSEFFDGIANLIVLLPFLISLFYFFSLPSCASNIHPIQGPCNAGFNFSVFYFYGIPIFVFGVFTVILLWQSAPEVYNKLKSSLTFVSKPQKPYVVLHKVEKEQRRSEFTYTPVEIKIGLLVAFLFTIIGGLLAISLLLASLGITGLATIIFSRFIQTSTIINVATVLVLPLLIVFILSFYLVIRVAKMWDAANKGDVNKLKKLNSTLWAIIAILTVFLAPTGIILLIMRSPIDNIKHGLSFRDLEKLSKLKKLLDEKVITKDIYEAERKRILGGLK